MKKKRLSARKMNTAFLNAIDLCVKNIEEHTEGEFAWSEDELFGYKAALRDVQGYFVAQYDILIK